jgi:hypothetical protein
MKNEAPRKSGWYRFHDHRNDEEPEIVRLQFRREPNESRVFGTVTRENWPISERPGLWGDKIDMYEYLTFAQHVIAKVVR